MLAPYIIIICGGLFSIILLNTLLTTLGIWYCIIITMLNFVLVLGVDIIIAWFIHSLPIKWFSPTKRIFKVYNWENKFYGNIGINKWKGYVAELGGLGKFRKNKVRALESSFMLRFLQESCCGEIIHGFCVIAGLANLVLINYHFLNFALPVVLVNAFLHIPPILIQRYNRPRLLRVYTLAKRREEKATFDEKAASQNSPQDE